MNLINGNSQADEPIIGAFLFFALIVQKCGEKIVQSSLQYLATVTLST